ncbi:MAG: tetratricopeptide repeat protein [Myxococcota bacterium]
MRTARKLICTLALLFACAVWWGCEPSRNDSAKEARATIATGATSAPNQGHSVQPLAGATPDQRSMLSKAKRHYLGGDFEKAEDLFAALVQTQPLSSEVVSGAIALGDIYASRGNLEEALEVYSALLKRAPNIPQVHYVVGRAYADMQKPDEAIAAYERALKLQPGMIFVWMELGNMYVLKGDERKSAEMYLQHEREVYARATKLESPGSTGVEERLAIVDVFSFLEDDRVTQALVKAATSDPSFEVRKAAATALGEVLAVASIPVLEEIAKGDESDEVRKAARGSLRALKEYKGPGAADDRLAPAKGTLEDAP